MPVNRSDTRCGWVLALVLALVLVSTGFGAEEAETPADTADFLEFLGSPEAESELWNTILDSVPDQLGENSPGSTEGQAKVGADE